MKTSDIPFAHHIGIEQKGDEVFLAFRNNVLNHLNTIHASAQFTLAETQSGIYLQSLFPELEGKVIPVLRDAQIKYKKPATEKIVAIASSDENALEKFKVQFEKKGRASMKIDVDIKDINGVMTSQASFTWFIQAI